MSTKKTIKEEMMPPVVVELPPQLTSSLERLADKLDKLDISIDYLTAAITGEDPLSISIGQSLGGRFVGPGKTGKIDEVKKVTGGVSEASFVETIREEILKIINEGK